jgi:hypothetical protein
MDYNRWLKAGDRRAKSEPTRNQKRLIKIVAKSSERAGAAPCKPEPVLAPSPSGGVL